MLSVLASDTGIIPVGRYGVSLNDVKSYYVDDVRFAASSTRAQIWSHFEQATAGLRSVVPVVCVWIGGSFLTSKVNPDDIDLVYWCQDTEINKVTDAKERLMLQLYAENKIRSLTGLRVDTHCCQWHIHPDADKQRTIEHTRYATNRGYWDDFWMRMRVGTKGQPSQMADALPRRGYFEISLDGFHGI